MKMIIFDFNGTLIDDCDLCLDILNILCQENNIGYVSKEKYMSIFNFPVSKYYEELGFDIKNEGFKNVGTRFHELYNARSYNEVKLFKNVKKVLNDLKGKYILVCLSASMQSTLMKQLKYYEIDTYFDYVVGLSDSYARSKKEVAINFISKFNIDKNEILLIGDSLHDKEVADAINVKSILMSTGHTLKCRLKKECNIVLDDLSEIYKYL